MNVRVRVTGLLLGLGCGVSAGMALAQWHQDRQPPVETVTRQTCHSLALETKHTVVFVENVGCVIIVTMKGKVQL